MRLRRQYGLTRISDLTGESTVAEACDAWLESVHAKVAAGTLSRSTEVAYAATVRLLLVPRCGALTLDTLTVGRCDRLIQAILLEQSVAAARRARSVLSLVIGYAVRDDAMPRNPIRDVQRLPLPQKKLAVLTPTQIEGIRGLMEAWPLRRSKRGPRIDNLMLVDGMDIMLGTSARVGECLALRRCDVDVTGNAWASINGTIVTVPERGTYRKDTPKRSRQIRRVALPARAAAAVRHRLALAAPGPDALLFAGRTGKAIDVQRFGRLLRMFVEDNRKDLVEMGVPVDALSPHLFRRTTATLVERAAGLTLASRLLGHANEQITRTSYVVSEEVVDPLTARVLDELLGS